MEKLKTEYANALLGLSQKYSSMENDLEKSIFIREIMDSPEVRQFLENKEVSKDEKKKILLEIFGEIAPDHIQGFIDLMIHTNKGDKIVPILNQYIDNINRTIGKIDAIVVSANELTSVQLQSIQTILVKQTTMEVNLINQIDPSIIAGFYIMIDGQIFDGTLRSKLSTMKDNLRKGN